MLTPFLQYQNQTGMKYVFITAVVLLGMGCAATKKSSVNMYPLNGTWIPVKQEMGGKDLPAAVYKTQKLILRNSVYIFNAESEDNGTVQYSNGQMDIYGKQGVNKGRHFTALYKLENGQLMVVYNLKGDSYPAGFETASKPGLFLSVYKKE